LRHSLNSHKNTELFSLSTFRHRAPSQLKIALRSPALELCRLAIGHLIALHWTSDLAAYRLELYGGGGGSIPPKAIFDAFPQIWALAASGKLRINIEQAPLAAVETLWQRQDLPGRRLVFIP
jgi:hypothetical protein